MHIFTFKQLTSLKVFGRLPFILIVSLILLLATPCCHAQNTNRAGGVNDNFRPKYQLSLNFGSQMSGIKDEDFVSSNFSPLLNITAGKWFAPSLALQIGYKGWYFNYISDNRKHFYGYYYGEALFNIKSLITGQKNLGKWNFYIHTGSGYFYNYDYRRPNICANIGFSSALLLTEYLQISIQTSAIMGWDIYQGNDDILPGISIGTNYLF